MAFIDEAAGIFEGPHQKDARTMLTRGRHIDPKTGGGGHCVWLISQRYVGFDKTAREQCSLAYVFHVGASDADDLADWWGAPVVAKAARLPKLHYLHVNSLGQAKAGRLTF
ncbi:MAG: hypothetical protein IT442_16740 [Phycisphaeraceae bacterium]|nr:hypothetical protein [Phycisphaeraceae bacterium]